MLPVTSSGTVITLSVRFFPKLVWIGVEGGWWGWWGWWGWGIKDLTCVKQIQFGSQSGVHFVYTIDRHFDQSESCIYSLNRNCEAVNW